MSKVPDESFVGEPVNFMGSHVFINPGTGPVEDATVENATKNMEQYVRDCPCASRFERDESGDYGEGRFCFFVYWDECPDKSKEIQMPGLPLERVRFLGLENQNIWHYPRLYVDGSSWVWKYGLLKRYNWFPDEDEE